MNLLRRIQRSSLLLATGSMSLAAFGCQPPATDDAAAPASSVAVPVEAREVAFGAREVRAGAAFEVGLLFAMELDTRIKPRDARAGGEVASVLGSTFEVVLRDEVLTMEGDEPSRVRVTYLKSRESELGEDHRATERVSPLEGRIFELTRDGGRWTVQGRGGEKVSDEDARTVTEQHRMSAFEPEDEAITALAGRSMRVGDRSFDLERALTRMLEIGRVDRGGDGGASARLGAPPDERGLAMFEVGLPVTLSDGPITVRFPLVGTAAVAARDGSLRRLRLSAPATISAGAGEAGRAIEASGSGMLTISVRFRRIEP